MLQRLQSPIGTIAVIRARRTVAISWVELVAVFIARGTDFPATERFLIDFAPAQTDLKRNCRRIVVPDVKHKGVISRLLVYFADCEIADA